MKTIITAFILLGAGMLISVICPAQTTIGFTYDASGNRISRSMVASGNAVDKDNSCIFAQQSKLVEDQIGGQQVRISYNPEAETIQVNFPDLTTQEAIIQINNPHGKQIVLQIGIAPGNKIDLSKYPFGSYQITITVGKEKKEWKILRT